MRRPAWRHRDSAEATLRLIPGYIPAVTLSAESDGPAGSVGLPVQSMFVAKFFGDVRGIDPDRPGVADFGKELYNLSVLRDWKGRSASGT